MAQGYHQYTKAYQKTSVTTVDQRKLIVLMYDGAIKFLTVAVKKLELGDKFEAHTNLVRGKTIVAELLGSLDMERGGAIAGNLQRLYAYMFNQLIDANLHNDPVRVNHVIELLRDLRGAWKDLPTVKQATGAAPGPRLPEETPAQRKINLRG